MITFVNNYYPVVRLLHVALSCICHIDSTKLHIYDRGWELLIKIDDAANFDIAAVAKFALDVCTALFKYFDAHYVIFAQYDQQSGEIRIPYKDLEPEKFYEACVKDNIRYTILDTITT